MHATYFRGRSALACCLLILLAWSAPAHAEGWESIDLQHLMARSRYIGVGTLTINGRLVDGRLRGKITFTQQLYSGIGAVKDYPVAIPPETVPGKWQNWPSRKQGIWFILKDGDAYQPVNHPACWMDESQAKAVAEQVYQSAAKAYEAAKAAAKQQSSGKTSDSSDGNPSVAAYAAMVAAAETMLNVPFRDSAQQSRTFYQNVMSILDTAGIKPPIGGNLGNAAGQNEFFGKAKQLLGPAGAAMGNLPGVGDPARATQLAGAQKNIASVYLELIRSTLGSANPAESIKKMRPIPLELPGGADMPPTAGPPSFPPGPGPGPAPTPGATPASKAGEFRLPDEMLNSVPSNGSRKQMLSAMVEEKPGRTPPKPPGPKGPGGPPGPR